MELLQYAIACDAAYEEELPDDSVLNDRYDHVEQYRIGAAAAFVAYNTDRTDFLIVYRGTDQVKDVWRAYKVARKGFGDMGDELRLFNLIEMEFREIHWTRNTLLMTGHSWGGVLAMHHAARIRPDECVTFGCPRIGQPEVAHTRVVNGHDFVPWLLPGFHHTGELVQLPGSRWSCVWDHFASSYVKKLRNQ